MSKIDVVLINPGKDDVSVGVGPTLLVAKAGQATEVALVDTSADAYGMLIAGVAIVPVGVPIDDLIGVPVAQTQAATAEHEGDDDPAPKPKPKRSRARK